jgi:hypothetical protein
MLQDLGSPTWASPLLDRLRQRGPARATAADWIKFILASSEHGIGKDEIQFSGVTHALRQQYRDHESLTRREVLATAALEPVKPRLQVMVDDSFNPSDEWAEIATRIEPKQYVKHGVFGTWPGSRYTKRYRHRSLGWSVVLARHVDLMHPVGKWWLVLDAKGRRAAEQPEYGFADAPSAIAHASHLMRQQFRRGGRERHAPRWKRYSLDGLGPYLESLITLPQWPADYFSPVHFPGVRNLLLHLRTNVCSADDGRRVLFLDEVQSDWHASVAKHRDGPDDEAGRTEADVPFAREWPLLALKFALWRAGKDGLDGVAWSTPDLHMHRWRGRNPPTEVYRRGLPDAAGRIARVLSLRQTHASLLRRRVREDGRPNRGWRVLNADGQPMCGAFTSREQADHFADITCAADRLEVPVLWLQPGRRYDHMPLFGVGQAAVWASTPTTHEARAMHKA